MPGVFYNANNVAVGFAAFHLAPYVAGSVADLTSAPTQFGESWDAPWFEPGGTDQGYSISPNQNTQDVTIEEQAATVLTALTTKNFQVTGALAEDTAVNRGLFNGDTLDLTDPAHPVATGSDAIQLYTACIEWLDADGKIVRRYAPRGTLVGTGDVAFRRSDKHMYGIQWTSACNTDQIVETTTDVA